jgi:hypothetical protein
MLIFVRQALNNRPRIRRDAGRAAVHQPPPNSSGWFPELHIAVHSDPLRQNGPHCEIQHDQRDQKESEGGSLSNAKPLVNKIGGNYEPRCRSKNQAHHSQRK